MAIANWPWKPAPDYRRLLAALRRQGSAVNAPFLELLADSEIIADVLGEPTVPESVAASDRSAMERLLDQKIRFWHGLGYDAFWQGASLVFPDLLSLDAEDTASLRRDRRRWVDENTGAISDWASFERYRWPRPEDADFGPMDYVAKHLPDGMAIIASVDGVLETAMWVMGYASFGLAIYDQPDLIEAIFARLEEILVPLARTVVQMDRVVALWLGDDMGFKTQPMIAPSHLRRYVFPIQKKLAAIAHQRNLPFLLHSCGNLEMVMDDLIDDVRIDAKHSFEDVIEPVESFAARYAGRISIVGGIDMDLLSRGSEERVRARTREVLEACAPTRAYVLGSGNTVANYIPSCNFLAMLDEGWRFNKGR